MKKLLGLDTSSFRILREDNYVYVDKTEWIHKLITTGRAYFLSRPRRFGKSLTISTFKELFGGNKELFKNLYIEDKWEFKACPVLVFDFNKIGNSTADAFQDNIRFLLGKFYEENALDIPGTDDITMLFSELITGLYRKHNQRVVVLVDEYDKPIIDHLGHGGACIDTARKNRYLLKILFGASKESGVADVLEFVFVTGVSRFSKISIFSEWNNLKDITMLGAYADLSVTCLCKKTCAQL